MKKALYVTKTQLPDLDRYNSLLKKIWDTSIVTNNGENVQNLEHELVKKKYANNIALTNSGTQALLLAIKCAELKDDVITTPFSYVATTSSIVWSNCNPIFVDIDPKTFTIDENKIEEKITKKTTGILATHVFGNPCNVKTIKEIATKHNLKVIYDNAHGFGVRYNNKPLANYGNISIFSFHATKPFHTIEGGGVVCKNKVDLETIKYMRSFGHKDYHKFQGVGINGKLSELHAAIGLLSLKSFNDSLLKKKRISDYYSKNLDRTQIGTQQIRKYVEYTYPYYPILFQSKKVNEKVVKALKKNKVFPRRYFYPSLNTLPYIYNKQPMPIAEDISERILCIPLYAEMSLDEAERVTLIINKAIK